MQNKAHPEAKESDTMLVKKGEPFLKIQATNLRKCKRTSGQRIN